MARPVPFRAPYFVMASQAFDQCAVLASNNKRNLDRLKDVIIDVVGEKRDDGSIWRD